MNEHLTQLANEEELERLTFARELTGETEVQQAQRIFVDAVPIAAEALVRIVRFSDNERNKLQAANLILDRAMGRVQDNPPIMPDDPYTLLLRECVIAVGDTADTTDEPA